MAVKKYLDLVGLQNYHVGILKNFTSDVTYGNIYTLLSTEPADWSTNYANYYTKSGDDYVHVSGSTAPTFAENTYYSAVKELQFNKYLSASIVDGDIVKGNPSNTKLFSIEDLKTDLGLGNAAYQDVTSTYDSTDTVAPISGAGVAQAISGITEPMIFEGGVTVQVSKSGDDYVYTITNFGDHTGTSYSPTGIKKGWTYKIVEITYDEGVTGGTLKEGDTLIAKTATPAAVITADTNWTIIPSGDEPSGTVTGITIADDVTGSGTSDAITASEVSSGGVVTLTVNKATDSAFGVVKTGTNITNTNGVISVADATTSSKGVVQVGTNIDATDGIISVKTGSTSDKGVLQVGTNLSVADGVVSVATGSATASGDPETIATTLGVLAPDYNSIQATDGVISVNTVATSDITALFA